MPHPGPEPQRLAPEREPAYPCSQPNPPPHLHSQPHFASIAPETRRTDEADAHPVYRTGPDTGRTGRRPYRKPPAVSTPPRPAPTPFILCADDYGFSPGISSAIRDLIDRGRLSATSCMTMSPFWPDHASWLKPYADQVDVGLHLTLTDQRPLGPMPRTAPGDRFPPLRMLMRKALTRQLDQGEIDSELNRQLDAFERAFGRVPSHIDGHQHIHQLPVVRQAVIKAVTESVKGAENLLEIMQ